MQPINKITNRRIKKPNPQNFTSMESQYKKEQEKIQNKKRKLDEINNFRSKLYSDKITEKREAYKIIQKDIQNFQEKNDQIFFNRNQEKKLNEMKNLNYSDSLKNKQESEFMEKRKQMRISNNQNIDLYEKKIERSKFEKNDDMLNGIRNNRYNERHYKRNFL